MNLIEPYDKKNYITIESTTLSPYCFFECEYDLCIKNKNGVVNMIKIEKTEHVIKLLGIEKINRIIFVHSKYIESNTKIIIDFFSVTENYEILFDKKIMLPANCSCDEITTKICKLDDNKFVITWGDLTNDDNCYMCNFSYDDYKIKKLHNDVFGDYTFENVFCWSESYILYSKIVGYEKNKMIIMINNSDDNTNLCGIDNFMAVDHKNEDPIEFDSEILCVSTFESEQYFLIRIKIQERINILTLSTYCIDILVKIRLNKLEVVEMSDKIDCDKQYIKSSIFIDDIPKIFNSEYLKNIIS